MDGRRKRFVVGGGLLAALLVGGAVLGVVVARSEPGTPDPIVGWWAGDLRDSKASTPGMKVEVRADGTFDGGFRSSDIALAYNGSWERTGDGQYTFWLGTGENRRAVIPGTWQLSGETLMSNDPQSSEPYLLHRVTQGAYSRISMWR